MPPKGIDSVVVAELKVTQPAIEVPPVPEKSVHCDVLYDPGPNRRTLDIIFIHGLKVGGTQIANVV